MVILRSATGHWRRGALAALGAQTGLAAHMLLAALGLSVVLSRHPQALDLVRVAGGLYLAYLGAGLLRSDGHERPGRERAGHPFVAGLLTNLLNPKAVLFFAGVLPQFIVPGHSMTLQVLVLGVVDVLFGFLPWAAVVALGSRLGGFLTHPRRRRTWDRITGSLLAALGVWLVLPALAGAISDP